MELMMENHTLLPGSNITGGADGVPSWVATFDFVQMAVAIVGVVANTITFITLMKNGQEFSEIILLLFKYQSLMDCFICLQAAILFTMPPMIATGIYVIDVVLCQVWHSQYLYWMAVSASIYNLVTLSVERYICICHPLKYTLLTKGKMVKMVVVTSVAVFIYLIPAWFQTRMRNGQCYSELYWDDQATARLYHAYSISAFFLIYASPCTVFFVTYGLVILKFRSRAKTDLGASGTASVIDKASTELTKTAIVVTVVFIIAIGVDLWYYLLAHFGLVPYVFNSPIQKVAVFFSMLNSVANPFVYASFMPSYRRSVTKTFFKSCSERKTAA